MALPDPLPDNPQRWDGWKFYNSDDPYERLCLAFDSNPSASQIEENCRKLLVWWQKKLPLKNQPSNPVSQLLRGGLDEAPAFLADARTRLLDPELRAQLDREKHAKVVEEALGEFQKLLAFSISEQKLREADELRLYETGARLGLTRDLMRGTVDAELAHLGARRLATPAPVPIAVPAAAVSAPAAQPAWTEAPDSPNGAPLKNPFDEFRHMLRLSRLCLDGEEMTDGQRDAMCNMGESLGLTGGQAEDLIDEYLESVAGLPMAPPTAARAPAPPARPAAKPVAVPVAAASSKAQSGPILPAAVVFNGSPLARAQERQRFANFVNTLGAEMLLVPSGTFYMGSNAHDAAPHEQPVAQVSVSCFYMSRFPVTNGQFEKFDATHRNKRAPWADETHPVVYVNSREAEKFCVWLSNREGKKYRLPTEAEWEYAARGMDGRNFPWGNQFDAGHYANFADARTAFAWREAALDDGFAETAPVGKFPKGAGPFGIEDLAGNVYEWCLDFFDAYRAKERVNPRGPTTGQKRIYRGGSWKARIGNLRSTARNFNAPDFTSNDVGFRIICECE